MLSLVCIARDVFFFLGRVHVISTGPISPVQTERSGVLHPPGAEIKLLLQALNSALLNTDRSHKTALTADEKRYFSSLYLLK
ncbi:unnamed protein product [Staurois parvus]|uniref:Uncharacterized protein n=1 Tax=Staurois parvus TaxID=386267 RepID=A0ABN9HTZ9_9NEOB|nr:unnamed protein product [Staurois parvus]